MVSVAPVSLPGISPVETVRAMREALGALAGASDAERVDLLRALEELKGAAAAAQARETVALDASQRRAQAEAGEPARRQGRGVAAQVGLARRDGTHRGARHLGLAKTLVGEMPYTLAALSRGRLSEWRATLLARETAILSADQRALVDRELCADATTLDGLGDKGVVDAARRMAQRLDPAAAVRRCARAAQDRRVSIRPMPDTMSLVSALLPVGQGVALYAALGRAADSARAAGDPRGRGQVMADTLVARVTGQSDAEAVPVALSLVMTPESLFAGGHEPALVPGHGHVPAAWARELLRTALTHADAATRTFLTRLFTDAPTGRVVATDSRARRFPTGLAGLISTRDAGLCRIPWCEAPLRHLDHVSEHADGGATSEVNGQGLCEACNHAKQAPGWRATGTHPPGRRHTVDTTTPTGHRYRSPAPPLPGGPPGGTADPRDPDRPSRLEIYVYDLILAA